MFHHRLQLATGTAGRTCHVSILFVDRGSTVWYCRTGATPAATCVVAGADADMRPPLHCRMCPHEPASEAVFSSHHHQLLICTYTYTSTCVCVYVSSVKIKQCLISVVEGGTCTDLLVATSPQNRHRDSGEWRWPVCAGPRNAIMSLSHLSFHGQTTCCTY